MPKSDAIKRKWLAFRAQTMGIHVPPHHLVFAKRCFYAGVATMLELLQETTEAVSDDNAGIDDGANRIEMLYGELVEFAEEEKARRE